MLQNSPRLLLLMRWRFDEILRLKLQDIDGSYLSVSHSEEQDLVPDQRLYQDAEDGSDVALQEEAQASVGVLSSCLPVFLSLFLSFYPIFLSLPSALQPLSLSYLFILLLLSLPPSFVPTYFLCLLSCAHPSIFHSILDFCTGLKTETRLTLYFYF